MTFLTLNLRGTLLSLAVGALLFLLGGTHGLFFVLVMAAFLVLSALVTSIGPEFKKKIGTFQASRGVRNVLANGLPALIAALLYWLAPSINLNTFGMMMLFTCFIAAVAAITADKFSSELGVFGGVPRAILGFKKVKRGTSGGITLLGLASSLAGSAIIAATVFFQSDLYTYVTCNGFSIADCMYYRIPLAVPFLVILISGFAGSLVDSVLGCFEERGRGNKYTSNFMCGLAGVIVAAALWLLIFGIKV